MSQAHIQAMLDLANQAAEESGIDMNEAVKGGGGGRLLPAGYAIAQLVEYTEFGQQPQEFQGTKKDPAMGFALGFALSGATPTGEKYNNDDGTPYVIRPYSLALSQNEKAGSFLLFKKMNYKGTAKAFGQLIGQRWLVKIEHVPKSKNDPKIVSRIDLKSFLPPNDPVSGMPYPYTEAGPDLYRMFLWSKPTLEGWKALFIEGTYEAKDGKPAASKNRLQETILAALDFQGSPLQQLLAGNGVALPTVAPATVAAPVSTVVVPSTPAVVQPTSPVIQPPQVVVPLVQSAPVVIAPPGPVVVAPPVVNPVVLPA